MVTYDYEVHEIIPIEEQLNPDMKVKSQEIVLLSSCFYLSWTEKKRIGKSWKMTIRGCILAKLLDDKSKLARMVAGICEFYFLC
jgi:hypothetical protein